MCGIVAWIQHDGAPIERGVLEGMVRTLRHRGPDGMGVRLAGDTRAPVALGHTRLKVIDLSEDAAQPMGTPDGSIWLVFNGEIYNYKQLRQKLAARGVQFQTASDTEVLLHLYALEGEAAFRQLDGMFAIAVWDGRRRELVLARDRAGKKPLFYHASSSRFVCASEVKAILEHPAISPEVDSSRLASFFLYGYVPSPGTLTRGIRKLPPGHWMRVSAEGKTTITSFWELPTLEAAHRSVPNRRQAADRVRQLMHAAVERRLISDVPLGAFLSGGIDSTIVVGLMSQMMKEPVRTFSIGFSGDPRFDETHYARLAAQRFGTRHTEFVVEPSSIELVERLVWHHDGPFADSSAIPTYVLSKLTREHVTVALNGDGGDELFAGYLRFYAAILAERAPAGLRKAAANVLNLLPAGHGHRSLSQRIKKFAGSAALPFIERYSRWNSVFYEDLNQLLAPHAADPVQESLALLEPALSSSGSSTLLTQLLHLNFKTYLQDDLLVKMDRCAMAHGLETRSPFLDTELMEYAFTLPDSMKLRFGKTKAILKEAFSDLLPPPIARRGKMGFGVPLRAWFTQDLREYLQDLLLAPDAKLRGYLNQDYVRKLWEEHCAGAADHSGRLWTVLTFEVWLRQMEQSKQRSIETNVLKQVS